MKSILFTFAVLLPLFVAADDSKPNFLLLRHHQRMILVGAQGQTNFEILNYEPLFAWEGQHSKATFTSDMDDIRVEFKLDIVGPDWLFVTLTETDEGLLLSVRRTSTGGVDADVDTNWYSNYAALMDDPKYSSAVSALLRRCGQNPALPELRALRTTYFGLAPVANTPVESQCQLLVQQLNDDQWAVREAALEHLATAAMAPYALTLAKSIHLSPEQRMSIDALVDRYRIDFDPSLRTALEARVLVAVAPAQD